MTKRPKLKKVELFGIFQRKSLYLGKFKIFSFMNDNKITFYSNTEFTSYIFHDVSYEYIGHREWNLFHSRYLTATSIARGEQIFDPAPIRIPYGGRTSFQPPMSNAHGGLIFDPGGAHRVSAHQIFEP
uniref:Uncharacterized protein n=1 Tax=Monomastix sp. (strain OKE-1) TaxID=141716 RepID=U5YDR6_MONSK|nr:hypothetical protein [Monomastix sp. OKE-1]AGZ90224.1 hypothetical protein [Monomastix sp. OKE-1]